MAISNKYNAGVLLQEALLRDLKPALEKRILNNMIEEFKEKAKPVISEAVSNLAVDKVEHYRDLAKIEEQVSVYLRWRDDES